MARSEMALSFANMSSATLYQYRGTSRQSLESGWRIGNLGSYLNHNICISFKPSVPLSEVEITLSADTVAGTFYYRLSPASSHPGIDWVTGGTAFSFSSNKATITLNQTFEAGKTYDLWIATTYNNANTYALFYDSGFSCSSTVATYTVSYNANRGSAAPGAQTKTHGVALTLSTTKPTKASTTAAGSKVTFNANGGTTTKGSATATDTTDYTFSAWNTDANGGGTSYAPGGSYTANASATLYAQYSAETTKGAVTLPTAEECQRAGYELLGFAASASAEEAAYAPGASYTASAAVTLYAVWAALGLAFVDNGASVDAYQVFIEDGSAFGQYAPFVDYGTKWEEMS